MSSRFPGISEPEQTLESVHNTVLEMKQALEILMGQRGAPEEITATTAQTLAQSLATVVFTTTIASGLITLPSDTAIVYVAYIETEAAGASDALDNVIGGKIGTIVVLRAYDATHDVVVTNGTPLQLAGASSFTLDHTDDTIVLIKATSTVWTELCRATNS